MSDTFFSALTINYKLKIKCIILTDPIDCICINSKIKQIENDGYDIMNVNTIPNGFEILVMEKDKILDTSGLKLSSSKTMML